MPGAQQETFAWSTYVPWYVPGMYVCMTDNECVMCYVHRFFGYFSGFEERSKRAAAAATTATTAYDMGDQR